MEWHPGWGFRAQQTEEGIPGEGLSLSGVMRASMQEWRPNVGIRVPKPVRRTKGVTVRSRSLSLHRQTKGLYAGGVM